MIWIEVYNAHRDITQPDLLVLQLKYSTKKNFSKFILGVPVLRRGKPRLQWTLSHLQRELIIASTPHCNAEYYKHFECEIQQQQVSTEEQGSGFDPLLCAASSVFAAQWGTRKQVSQGAFLQTESHCNVRNSGWRQREEFSAGFLSPFLTFRAQEPVNQKGAVLAPQPSSPVCYISLQAWIY